MRIVTGKVLSVNVGGIRHFDYEGRKARSAIWKSPVTGRVKARGINLDGDDQADRRAHGGPDKAVYAYAIEDHRWWAAKSGERWLTVNLGKT
jgi:MOSC domain-containing protein YiiM